MFQRGLLLFGLLLTLALILAGQSTADSARQEDITYVYMFQFSPDSKTILGYNGETLFTWDLESRKLLRSQRAKAEKTTFGPHGQLLSMIGDATGLHLFDVVANKDVKFLESADFSSLSHFAFTPDGKTLAFTPGVHSYVIKLWDVTTGKEKVSIERPDPDDFLRTLRFSPGGENLAGLSRSLTLWSSLTGKQSRLIEISGSLARMAFSPDGKTICVNGFSNMQSSFVKCFSVLSGREVLSVQADASSPFAFSPDGRVLAVTRSLGGIFLINMATRRDIAKLTISGESHSFSEMSFSPDGKLLAVAATHGLVLFDHATRKQLFVLTEGSRVSEAAKPE